MSRLVFAQTLYARDPWLFTPAYPPIFPFLGPSGQRLIVVNMAGAIITAMSGQVQALVVDLSPLIGPTDTIANTNVWLLEGANADRWPQTRLLGPPSVITIKRRFRQAIQQNLVDLQTGGEYVAIVSARLNDGSMEGYVAPFNAFGLPGSGLNFLYDDSDPPRILTDDDGVPLTAD
jgi:hypothetical protein